MPSQSTYKGRRVEVEGVFDEDSRLTIDGQDVDVIKDEDSGAYRSAILPYETFDSLERLAHALIDRGQ